MSRAILTLTIALIFVTAAFTLKACSRLGDRESAVAPISEDIVVLANGMVVTAPDRSVAQQLIAWLERPEESHQVFHLGGVQFEGRSTVPTTATQHRVPTLVRMLTAYPDVKARFIGYTGPTRHPRDDRAVEIARANWAVAALADAGIDRERLTARAATGAERRSDPSASPERVDLELSQQ